MKKIHILLLSTVLFITSCTEVLDKQPLDIISDASVWSDPALIDSYLLECYAEMVLSWETQYNASGPGSGFYVWFPMNYQLTIADEAGRGWTGVVKSKNIGPSGGKVEWWGYPTIRRLNVFLEQLEPMDLPASYKSERLAEARYLRAHAYFNLVKRYGGVPLITRVQQLDDSEDELYPARNKESEIYDFIISELDDIKNDLVGSQAGRATKWAAVALKSRAAMYAGSIATWGNVQLDGLVGIPAGNANQYWQASYNASKELIENGGFSLYNATPGDKTANFRNLFLDEGNSEVIFSEIFDGLSGKGHTYDMINVPKGYHVWNAGQASSVYLEMAESFDNIDGTTGVIDRTKIASGYKWTIDELFGNKDPRFGASIYTHGTSWLNGGAVLDFHKTINTPSGNINAGSYKGVLAKSRMKKARNPFGVLKYLDEVERSAVMERNHSDTDYIIFRLGEVLLNYAEAAIELGLVADATSAINQLRTRAGMPTFTSVDRDIVRKERKIELAFEGNRYWDLRRWRTAATELSKSPSALKIILEGDSYTKGAYDVLSAKFSLQIVRNVDGKQGHYFDASRHYYLPISLKRTGANANLVENPGYE
jgi:hypothetical protein|tara:strand:- start:692 stop:2479 length:1788 start_codon:yes stop_codon:yes gene_type:complete